MEHVKLVVGDKVYCDEEPVRFNLEMVGPYSVGIRVELNQKPASQEEVTSAVAAALGLGPETYPALHQVPAADTDKEAS